MKVLIVDDDLCILASLERQVECWGYNVILASNGDEALSILNDDDPPLIVLLDWMMPKKDGIEVLKEIRASPLGESVYFIMLTAREKTDSLSEALKYGANDYIQKPYNVKELNARINVAERMIILQREKEERIRQLEEAKIEINELRSLLPVCSVCKKICTDGNEWVPIESYVENNTKTDLTHTYCPSCYEQAVNEIKKIKGNCDD